MAKIHVMIQIGGVGKTVCASILFQALVWKKHPVIGIDTDPDYSQFGKYKNENNGNPRIDSLKDFVGLEEINPAYPQENVVRLFKRLNDVSDNNLHIIIDVCPSFYRPIADYLSTGEAVATLLKTGHTICLHMPVVAHRIIDTLKDIDKVCSFQKGLKVAPWINPYMGDVLDAVVNQTCYKITSYEDIESFAKLKSAGMLQGIVLINNQCDISKSGHALQLLFSEHQFFDSAIQSSKTMTSRRVKMFWEETRKEVAAKLGI